ncbi:hypothetical protein BC936DRAFT_140426 [Jimgerdemannia flammicorona]|uniref:Uncharacterized protein n=1 Tax=Jimgerdemannia flammicorona TaxID=994334 RepID=A0A433ATX8_9FUNG|nr:hypothetical protein BC936DRAFT_140426 [Jimgerdemannia flammicorona]
MNTAYKEAEHTFSPFAVWKISDWGRRLPLLLQPMTNVISGHVSIGLSWNRHRPHNVSIDGNAGER